MRFPDKPLQDGFTLALFQPKDAPGIVRCYREIYGDGFPLRHVYDADALIEKNTHGGQYTLVVRTPDNDVAGLAGLVPVDAENRLYEACQLMVRRDFRVLKLGQILARAILKELSPAIQANAVFAEAVCSSTISQKMSAAYGLEPTGLALDVLPEQHGGKTAFLYMFKAFNDHPQTLFAAARDREFLQDSCQRLGLTRGFGIGTPPRETTTRSHEERLDFAELMRVRVETVGQNFESWLDDFMRHHQKCMAQIQINLTDPSAPWATDRLRARGFFLGAHLPLWKGADYLMLQYLPRRPTLEAVQLLPGQSQTILARVKADLEHGTA